MQGARFRIHDSRVQVGDTGYYTERNELPGFPKRPRCSPKGKLQRTLVGSSTPAQRKGDKIQESRFKAPALRNKYSFSNTIYPDQPMPAGDYRAALPLSDPAPLSQSNASQRTIYKRIGMTRPIGNTRLAQSCLMSSEASRTSKSKTRTPKFKRRF